MGMIIGVMKFKGLYIELIFDNIFLWIGVFFWFKMWKLKLFDFIFYWMFNV